MDLDVDLLQSKFQEVDKNIQLSYDGYISFRSEKYFIQLAYTNDTIFILKYEFKKDGIELINKLKDFCNNKINIVSNLINLTVRKKFWKNCGFEFENNLFVYGINYGKSDFEVSYTDDEYFLISLKFLETKFKKIDKDIKMSTQVTTTFYSKNTKIELNCPEYFTLNIFEFEFKKSGFELIDELKKFCREFNIFSIKIIGIKEKEKIDFWKKCGFVFENNKIIWSIKFKR